MRWQGVDAEVGQEAIVQLESNEDAAERLRPLGLLPLRLLLPSRRLWLVRDASGARDGLAVAQSLRRTDSARFAEPDLYFPRVRASMPVPPNDPRYPGQWYLSRIDIERAWARSTGARGVTIQIIDNGCDAAHADLAPHLLAGRDVLAGDEDPSVTDTGPGANHGTACAGVAAGVGNNALGIAGTCPECRVRCVRLLGADGTLVPVSADVAAMQFAIEHSDVAVVSNSWGFDQPIAVPESLKMAIEDVSVLGRGGKGALVVFAAGNDNRELQSSELYSMPQVVTVGAVNNFDEAAPFSNRGAAVDLTAPTGSLTLDLTGAAGASAGDYTSLFGGTSAACPVVAGVAGLLFAAKPEATAAEVREVLAATARRAPYAVPDATGHDPLYGFGVVDPAAALERLLGPPDAGAPEPVEVVAEEPSPDASPGCGCTSSPSMGWLLPSLLAFARRRPFSPFTSNGARRCS